mgnify:CR=1 FL=1
MVPEAGLEPARPGEGSQDFLTTSIFIAARALLFRRGVRGLDYIFTLLDHEFRCAGI